MSAGLWLSPAATAGAPAAQPRGPAADAPGTDTDTDNTTESPASRASVDFPA
ncbi:hypothetical protein QRN89_28160 [Streptomyces chengbuensis]|uniref:hypothetical protein n=1 Tax=Streptomyces TaxID=1883 RepID=UPI0025B47A6A|nr:hypothetical protein [Streptomyces sp. HUAS CB01]WJY53344.1 hypothetical protein QRN89_28160 [Streptomyces sp. HUAS CB01]